MKLKSRLSVCPSDRHADISAVSAAIETGLARNEKTGSFGTSEYIYKSKRASIYPHECAKGSGVSQNSH